MRRAKYAKALAMALATAFGAAAQAAGPSGLLNDTGQTLCNNGGAMVACSAANTGDASPHPRQDGRFGRDAASPPKLGGGMAGFDFTRICWNGEAEGSAGCTGSLVANTSGMVGASPATDWACTQDNVTQLTWSLQSRVATFTGAASVDAHNADGGRCGGTGWRVPTVQELRSIVNYGASRPAIDGAYFPATENQWHWTSDGFAPNASLGWLIHFSDGRINTQGKTGSYPVRLVRSGQ